MSDQVLIFDLMVPAHIDGRKRKLTMAMKNHQRDTAFLMARNAREWFVPNPNKRYCIGLLRIAPRKMTNVRLEEGFRPIRDGIADAMGIDDGSPRIKWDYSQERGEPHVYAARVRIWEVRNG